jgi:hypothetical protein
VARKPPPERARPIFNAGSCCSGGLSSAMFAFTSQPIRNWFARSGRQFQATAGQGKTEVG